MHESKDLSRLAILRPCVWPVPSKEEEVLVGAGNFRWAVHVIYFQAPPLECRGRSAEAIGLDCAAYKTRLPQRVASTRSLQTTVNGWRSSRSHAVLRRELDMLVAMRTTQVLTDPIHSRTRSVLLVVV